LILPPRSLNSRLIDSTNQMRFRTLIAVLAVAFCAVSVRIWVSQAQGTGVTITIDAAANRRAINPNIYGVAYATTTELSDLNSPLNRSGGNATSQYNWLLNCDNRGSDFYFESLDSGGSTSGKLSDDFIAANKSVGAQSMVTIPLIGWVAKVPPNRGKLASFSIAKYGPQTGSDFMYFPDAGNGVRASDGQFVTGNDPNDANTPSDSQFQLGWMQHLTTRWGTASNGGLRYYLMDNEPSLWSWTHRDVHPTGPTMDEIRDKIIDYGSKVKTNDPSAVVVGPEEWGWNGYFYSGFDQQWGGLHGWNNLPDRAAHNGADYLPWVLEQLHQHDIQVGQRSLDVFAVHWYPQGGEAFSNDVSPAMSMLRNRSTRSLWDPNYTDQSWINSRVQLIPRIQGWVNTYYPGLQTGITEYNWGAEGFINGATAQADVYGIFGREGLDMGTRWTTPSALTPTYKAMKMYRNYDGNKSTFGDVSVSDTVPDPDTLSSFAAIRSIDGALTVMVINKSLASSTPANINIANFSAGSSAQVWQLTAANAINRLNDISSSGGSLSLTVPAQSITLMVIPAAAPFLFTEADPQRAVAVDSVTFLRGPFTMTTNNFSTDGRTRIALFAGNINLQTGDELTAQAEDSNQQSRPLTVEFVGKVPGYNWLTQVVVTFPESVPSPGDYLVSIKVNETPSNKARVTIGP
jgi:hypothetical protein